MAVRTLHADTFGYSKQGSRLVGRGQGPFTYKTLNTPNYSQISQANKNTSRTRVFPRTRASFSATHERSYPSASYTPTQSVKRRISYL